MYQKSTGHENSDRPIQDLSVSDCLHQGIGYPEERRNRGIGVGKAPECKSSSNERSIDMRKGMEVGSDTSTIKGCLSNHIIVGCGNIRLAECKILTSRNYLSIKIIVGKPDDMNQNVSNECCKSNPDDYSSTRIVVRNKSNQDSRRVLRSSMRPVDKPESLGIDTGDSDGYKSEPKSNKLCGAQSPTEC